MSEKYVLTYIDLDKADGIEVKYFDSEIEAYRYLKELKSTKDIMSELILSESKYEEFELINLEIDDEYDEY